MIFFETQLTILQVFYSQSYSVFQLQPSVHVSLSIQLKHLQYLPLIRFSLEIIGSLLQMIKTEARNLDSKMLSALLT